MLIQWFSRRSLPVLAVLLVPAAGYAVFAQTAEDTLTVQRIADERDRIAGLPHDFAWSPDGRYLAYLRKTSDLRRTSGRNPARRPLQVLEISGTDTTTGRKELLVSAADLSSAFPIDRSRPAEESENDDPAKSTRLRSFLWAPSGRALLLASGASLVWFDLDKHSARQLVQAKTELSHVTFSADGRAVSFVRDHSVWVVDVATAAVKPLTSPGSEDLREGEPDWPYAHELGLTTAYWWAPDSSSVAWLEADDRKVGKYSLRNAHGEEQQIAYPTPGGTIPTVHLFVRTLSADQPHPIDLGPDKGFYIPRVQWLPDGKQIAIERLSRDQKTLDLLLADAATGHTRTILTEKDVYWINLSDDLHFLQDSRRFVWSSERSGHRHLYLYDITGRVVAPLTRGDWDVNSLREVNESEGLVYFTATEASPLELQLYSVKLDGTGQKRISHEKGTHDVMFSPSGSLFLDAWSNHATPPREELYRADGTMVQSIGDTSPEAVAQANLGSVEFLTIKTHMGIELNASMLKPPDFDPAKKYPVIVYVAGGPGEEAVREVWGGDVSLWFAMMAQKGYVVFAVNNRGSAGRGHYFEEPVHLRFAATEMADVRDAVFYLHSQPWVDKGRLGICGWGFGGFLALHGMLDRPLLFKAGFAGSPVSDWHLYDAVFTERYLEDPTHNQDGWLSSSPLENAKFLSGSLLLAQSTLDEKTHLENSLMLLDELLDNGKYADILMFTDRRDLFEDHATRLILFQKLTNFFVANL